MVRLSKSESVPLRTLQPWYYWGCIRTSVKSSLKNRVGVGVDKGGKAEIAFPTKPLSELNR